MPFLLLLAFACLAAPSARAAASPYGPVCSNGEYLGDLGLSSQGQQRETRRIYYCPQGATVLQLMFAGSYVANPPAAPNTPSLPPAELNLVDPQVIDLSVETNVPPIWNSTTAYVAGNQVSGPVAANNGGATYVAVAPSQDAPPTAADTVHWQPIVAQPVPITCNGVRPCVLGTTTSASGQTVTNPFLVTDPLAVSIAPGSLIAIRTWIGQSGTQVVADGPSQGPMAGSYEFDGTTERDLTLSGSRTSSGPEHNTGAFALVGLPNAASAGPSVCILGDSRAGGVAGLGMSYAPIASGGQGYVASDIGQLVANVDTGGSADNTIQSAIYVIQNVSGGKVTQAGIYMPGHYAVARASTNPALASVLPVGPQPTQPLQSTTGSGLMINMPATGGLSAASGYSEDTRTFAQGFVQKGLSDAGIPFASFSREGDRVMTLATNNGDANRLAAIQKTGCTSAIMEYGINDIHAGESAAQIEAELVFVANQLYALGTVKAVYLATLQPETTSTDHWMTAANQVAVPANEARREAVNTWERGVPTPFVATFDVAAPVEVNAQNVLTLNGGLWIATGQPHFATPEGVHLSPGTAALSAAVITANAALLK